MPPPCRDESRAESTEIEKEKRRPARFGAALGLLLLLAVVPAPAPGASRVLNIPPLCPFRLMTGIPCPGCGITRALVCAAHGHWDDAMTFHPLGIVLLGLLTGAAFIRLLRLPLCISSKAANGAAYVTVAALGIVWVARLMHFLAYPP